jgi:hypothetical protein
MSFLNKYYPYVGVFGIFGGAKMLIYCLSRPALPAEAYAVMIGTGALIAASLSLAVCLAVHGCGLLASMLRS